MVGFSLLTPQTLLTLRTMLSLSLFVFGVLANNKNPPLGSGAVCFSGFASKDNLTFTANLFYRWLDFHRLCDTP